MKKEDLIRKLTSRKFWALLIALVTAIMLYFGAQDSNIQQICAIIGAFGSIVTYMMAEGVADSNHIEQKGEQNES